MFEKTKFKKKYKILYPYVKDKKTMTTLLNSSKVEKCYNQISNFLSQFIDKLKLLYPEEKVIDTIIEYLKKDNSENIKNYYNNLSMHIGYCKKIDNGNIDVLKDIEIKDITRNFFNIETTVTTLVFKKYYKKKVLIKGKDILEIFKKEPLKIQNILLEMAKNETLDSFAFVINELKIKTINNLENILSTKVNEKLFHPNIKEKLGDKTFNDLINYYFDTALIEERNIINGLLDENNYDLIIDLLHLPVEYKFYRCVKESEYKCDLFSLSKIKTQDIINIIYRHISSNIPYESKYINNLKADISDKKALDDFYRKYNDIINLFQQLNYNSFEKLSVEEQKKIYNYIKSLDENEKKLLIKRIEDLTSEAINMYKKEYAIEINKAQLMSNKAKEKEVKDDKGDIHNVKVYELKNEEPFTFLITVMHHNVRLYTTNMYGRPPHLLTIANPENFCKDLRGGSEIISTSLINETFIGTFVGPYADVMYVFGDIKADDIVGICPKDGAYPPIINKEIELFENTQPINPKGLIWETQKYNTYNEIAIKRKRENNLRIMPTAILCYDKINDISLKHAEYFNIPIIVINTKTYRRLNGYTEEKKEKGYSR